MQAFALLGLAALALAAPMRFDQYSVIRIADVEEGFGDALLSKIPSADIFVETSDSLEVLLSPEAMVTFKTEFPKARYTVVEPNMQRLIDLERATYKPSNFTKANDFFNDFRPMNEITTFVLNLAQEYPNLVHVEEVGKTIENRPIIGFTMGAGSPNGKPVVFFQALVHAREWLAGTTLLWIANHMVTNYGRDATVTELMDKISFFVVPVVNIDGYMFSWTSNRMWRKNRRPNPGGSFGVDINRNWGPASTWCTSGSSREPNSDTYCGTGPFSEPETTAMKNKIESYNGEVKAGIDFHTYGSLLLYPWQYTYTQLPPTERQVFINVGGQMQNAINAVHRGSFVNQQGSQLYPHSGGFVDYNYEVNKMVTFTIEGRGSNFVLPPSNIVPAGQEVYAGVVRLCQYVLAN